MKLIQSILLICLVLFANLNLFIYQNWCHGENIGYTINFKKFSNELKHSEKKDYPSFERDFCCKDILIKSNENSFFSFDSNFQHLIFTVLGIIPNVNWNLFNWASFQQEGVAQLYCNPPPPVYQLYKFYCRYTYYG